MNETIGLIIISIGIMFDFFGCVGLVRLPDIYNRLQAATKCVTLGTCLILLGALLINGVSALGIKAVICIVFILVTSPTAAHALARGAHQSGVKLWEKSVCDKYEEDKHV
ncbi:MAG: Na+/H+ antiporter subunit G [Candidatus Nealsonbacteria bacterium]|nr:MAG: Na+/H+ antiporter subunit G [Candidatus Nealsonbacteria bacterium]